MHIYLNSSDSVTETTNSNTVIWSSTAATKDWNTDSNWDGGNVPANNQDVVIPISTNYPLITNHIKTGDLIIDSSAEINIDSNGTLDISYDLTNNGTITVNNSGSLLIRKSSEPLGTGDYNIIRNSPEYLEKYFHSYWSSPTVNTDPSITFPNNPVIYYFNSIEEIDSKDFTVYIDVEKELIVEYAYDVDNIKEVSLFNLQSRRVVTFLGTKNKNISNLSKGIYIVNATLQDNRKLTKR